MRILSKLFLFIPPLVLSFFAFYEGQKTSVAFSFSGIFLLIIVWLTFYKRFKEWHKEQRQAHQTARNLGQLSHETNFTVLHLGNFFFTSVPFVILILFDRVLASYKGNLSLWIVGIIVSIGVSSFFGVLADYKEQLKIKVKQAEDGKAHAEQLAKTIKDTL